MFFFCVKEVNFLNFSTIIGIAFSATLIYAAVCDYKTLEIPDKVHIIILILGLANIIYSGFTVSRFLMALLGLAIIFVPFFIASIIGFSMGVGDIKLISSCCFFYVSSCGFMYGLSGVLFGAALGWIVVLIVHPIYAKIKNIKLNAPFAQVPYLAIGFISINVLINFLR